MYYYEHFGLVFGSEVAIQNVRTVDGPADVRIRLGKVPFPPARSGVDEEVSGVKDFGAIRVSGGNEIVLDLQPQANEDLLRVFLLGRYTAQVLRQRGWFPLHASAVRIGASAALFLAPSGTGKSTTAASLHARGHEVLSDDIAPVQVVQGKCMIRPGSLSLRLTSESAAFFGDLDPDAGYCWDKHDFRLDRERPTTEPVPVKRIYSLQPGESVGIQPVDPITSVQFLGRDCFVRLGRATPDLLRNHLRDCTAIAELGLLHRLVRPAGMAHLAEIANLVEEDMATQAGGPRSTV